MAYRKHKKMQVETLTASGYATTAVVQPVDDDLSESAIDAFASLATATSVDRGMVATLTDANSCLTKQEENAQASKEIRALLKKERNERGARKPFTPYLDN
jgi:hypothetical protein